MNLSPAEYVKYILTKDIELKNIDKIEQQFTALTEEISNCKQEISSLYKQNEILSEQVYFRDTFIGQVLEACSTTPNKKELVKFIKLTLENSYIEL